MSVPSWRDLGPVEELQKPLQEIHIENTKIALTYKEGKFSAISGICNHVGGPLGQGTLEGDYVVCPWHHWKFHRGTGQGQPGYETQCVPRYDLKIEDDHLWIDLASATERRRTPHQPHPLARPVSETRNPGPIRVLGISTTAMERHYPRYSTSEDLLDSALKSAAEQQGAETKLIRLNDLHFRHCLGFYSKSAHACTWPCSITWMDPKDELTEVYEGLVHWADVVLVATPIRWGSASSLYFKMVERMNCIQNQITIHDKVLIRNKVAAFIVTGGQDNVLAVAGDMLGFFSELGFISPPFPYVAHSLGWTAEDMERNVAYVRESKELHDAARDLARRAIELAEKLWQDPIVREDIVRAGRKGNSGDPRETSTKN